MNIRIIPVTLFALCFLSHSLLGMIAGVTDATIVIPNRDVSYTYDYFGNAKIKIYLNDDNDPYPEFNLFHTIPVTMQQLNYLLQNGQITIADTTIRMPQDEATQLKIKNIYAKAEKDFMEFPAYHQEHLKLHLDHKILNKTPEGEIVHGVNSPINEVHQARIKAQHGSAYQMLKNREIGRK